MGRVIALTLARAGANVVVHYNESKEGAQASVREIESFGGRAIAARADVSRPKQVAAMFGAVEKRFGRLDLLVNNAGIFFPVKWDKLSEDDWDKILGINLKGAFFCAQAAARIMQPGPRPDRYHIFSGRASGVAGLHPLLRLEGGRHFAHALPGKGAGAAHSGEQCGARDNSLPG